MAYEGSCHCGKVAFRVDEDPPAKAVRCNCSHCRRKGFLLSFVPSRSLSIVRGEEVLTDYKFNKCAIVHRFCCLCGCQAFSHGKGPNGVEMASINLRCVPSIDLDTLDIQDVHGAKF